MRRLLRARCSRARVVPAARRLFRVGESVQAVFAAGVFHLFAGRHAVGKVAWMFRLGHSQPGRCWTGPGLSHSFTLLADGRPSRHYTAALLRQIPSLPPAAERRRR